MSNPPNIEKLAIKARYLQQNINWKKYPRLAATFQHRPPHNAYWIELVQLIKDIQDEQPIRQQLPSLDIQAQYTPDGRIALGLISPVLQCVIVSTPQELKYLAMTINRIADEAPIIQKPTNSG